MKLIIRLLLLISLGLLAGCSSSPPKNQHNLCVIFKQHPRWYWDARHAEQRWGVPISVQMAIIQQESHFRADIRPPRQRLLGLIPWLHPTTALGYAQATNATWHQYLVATHHFSASRANMRHATDFVGWFTEQAHRQLGIPKHNAFLLYLAYHQGLLGYADRDYRHQLWLIDIAHHVQHMANLYHRQLVSCRREIPRRLWF